MHPAPHSPWAGYTGQRWMLSVYIRRAAPADVVGWCTFRFSTALFFSFPLSHSTEREREKKQNNVQWFTTCERSSTIKLKASKFCCDMFTRHIHQKAQCNDKNIAQHSTATNTLVKNKRHNVKNAMPCGVIKRSRTSPAVSAAQHKKKKKKKNGRLHSQRG